MNPGESTWPIRIEWPDGRDGDPYEHSQTSDAWSFGTRERVFVPLSPRGSAEPAAERSAAANTIGSPTLDPPMTNISDLKPAALSRLFFGRRGFRPFYQWEGVVEEINSDGFRARLLPFEDGKADPSRVEYADFAYDDLADESDHDLVTEGAVFYWTVGKSRNAAGTYMNTSLVRFRRLPPSSQHQILEARREANALLTDLRGD